MPDSGNQVTEAHEHRRHTHKGEGVLRLEPVAVVESAAGGHDTVYGAGSGLRPTVIGSGRAHHGLHSEYRVERLHELHGDDGAPRHRRGRACPVLRHSRRPGPQGAGRPAGDAACDYLETRGETEELIQLCPQCDDYALARRQHLSRTPCRPSQAPWPSRAAHGHLSLNVTHETREDAPGVAQRLRQLQQGQRVARRRAQHTGLHLRDVRGGAQPKRPGRFRSMLDCNLGKSEQARLAGQGLWYTSGAAATYGRTVLESCTRPGVRSLASPHGARDPLAAAQGKTAFPAHDLQAGRLR